MKNNNIFRKKIVEHRKNNLQNGRIPSDNPLHITLEPELEVEAVEEVEGGSTSEVNADQDCLKNEPDEKKGKYVFHEEEKVSAEKEVSNFEVFFNEKYPKESEKKSFLEDAKEQVNRIKEEHGELYLEFVIDGTISFSKIFVPVYRAIENAVYEIEKAAMDVGDVKIKYGLTVMGDRSRLTRHNNTTRYVGDKDAFLNSVKEIRFTGGNLSGYEDIHENIENALKKLENSTPEYANRALIVFTDSKPENEDEDVSFFDIPGCPNRGIRFALIYLGSSEYYGYFKLVDKNGNDTEVGKNAFSEVRCISELLGADSVKSIRNLVYKLVYQTSVR